MITGQDAEALIVRLDRNAGAQVHTAGKARCYLRSIADKPDAKFSNCTADEFVKACKVAAYSGKWEELERISSRWW